MNVTKHIVRLFSYDYFLRRDGYRLPVHRRELAKTQYMSSDELASLQLARLRAMLTTAYTENAFYRERFRTCGFETGDLKDFDDLSGIPLLTKDDIRNELGRTFSSGFDKTNTVHKRTGGSTGVPIHIHMDFNAASYKKAAAERHDAWAGRVRGDRTAAIWGDTERVLPLKALVRNALSERLFFLDTLRFDESRLAAFTARIRRLRPPILIGHAHSIYQFSLYVRRVGLDDIRFRGIITTAMVLSQLERKTIEEIFQSPVFDRYGCEELSIVGSECEAHRGLHVCAEGLYVELIGENECIPRRLVITDLLNRAMPMIRYEVGDCGIWAEGECPCGRRLPRLLEISGRTADFLYTPEGMPVFGISILDTFVIHIPGMKQVQIIQDRYDHLDFFVVRDEQYTDESLALLDRNVKTIFGERMTYDIHFVGEIQTGGRGKFRFSICRIGDRKGQ